MAFPSPREEWVEEWSEVRREEREERIVWMRWDMSVREGGESAESARMEVGVEML